jgi:ribosomal protein L32
MSALRRLRKCPDCDAVLNAGRICECCGVVPVQTDIDCQQAIECVPGALLFARPHVSREKSRSDGR